jgi:hypothetical protein
MKTTIKVDTETRDLVRAASAERRTTFDETIKLGLAALTREARREQMRRESAAAAQDPDDLAEAHRVLAEMEAWGAR